MQQRQMQQRQMQQRQMQQRPPWGAAVVVSESGSFAAMGDDIQQAVRRLVDKDEIVDLVHRYSYYADHKFYDDLVGLFTEDCVVDYGPWVGPPTRSRKAFRANFGAGGGFVITSH